MKIQFFGQPVQENGNYTVVDARSEGLNNRDNRPVDAQRFAAVMATASFRVMNPAELLSVEQDSGYRLIQTGFRIGLPADIWMRWCRYSVVVRPVTPGGPPLPITSFHPARIREPIIYKGNLFLRDGQIEAVVDMAGKGDGWSFEKFIMGFKGEMEMNWDFFPARGILGVGTERLLLAIKAPAEVRLRVKSSLCMTIFHADFGDRNLETQPEVRDVNPGWTPGVG